MRPRSPNRPTRPQLQFDFLLPESTKADAARTSRSPRFSETGELLGTPWQIDKGTSARRHKIYPIISLHDCLADGEGDLLSVMRDMQKDGVVMAGLARLSRLVRAKRRYLPPEPHSRRQIAGITIKRSVQRERDSLLAKGFIALIQEMKPTFRGGVTGYRLRAEAEVWEFLHRAKINHWKRAGRGRKLLSIDPTADAVKLMANGDQLCLQDQMRTAER